MPKLKSFPLLYDPEKSKWYIHQKEQTILKHQALHWGFPLTPFSMSIHNGLLTPSDKIPMKAMVALEEQPKIGPLIGILTAENQNGKLKGNFNNFKAIMETGQTIGGIVFVFSPSCVDWKKRMIRGEIFNKYKNAWVTCSFPFPNVVYNRIQDRTHEDEVSSQSCIQRLLAQGVTLYNRGFFNKEEVIKVLNKSSKINKYIPKTNKLSSIADLIKMLQRYKAVYLKPTDNRLGSGIIRIRKSQAKKAFLMHYYADDKQLKKYHTSDIYQLWKKIRKQMCQSPYIIQQAIPLATVFTCPFDCRVLVQKNHKGKWQISGIGIRVAEHPQSITTHIPRGGSVGSLNIALQQAFPKLIPETIIKRIYRLCISAAKILDQHYQHLGEMSIDVGLDSNAHPWIFEANAKPMKFDEPEIRKNQLEQVIRYAQFLTFKK